MDGLRETAGQPSVGVLADDERRDRAVAAVETAGGDPLVGDGAVADGSAFLVAVGEDALLTAVRRAARTPMLAVDAGRGVASAPLADLESAVESALDGDAGRTERACVSVRRGDDSPVRVLFDVTLVTAEPARISEYCLRCDGDQVSQFRADGVVVATPAGTHGYAAAADGPLLAPGTGVVAAVPLAPFVTDREQWVLPDGALSLTVTRDEGEVSLYADDRLVGDVPTDAPVTVERDGTVELLTTPATEPFFDG